MLECMKKILFIILLGAIVFGLFKLYPMLMPKPQMPEQAPMPVMAIKPVRKDVPRFYEFTGTTAASESVEIRARVKGYLENIAFKDSENVEKGDLLFKIESGIYQAQLDMAKAELKSAQAQLERAQLDFDRVELAIKENAVSKQELSKRRAERDVAQALVSKAKAAIVAAQLDLDYTKITSPISGRISRKLVDIGNLVGASEMTLLTTVVKISPIDIYFDMSESILLKELRNRSNEVLYGDKTFYAKLVGDDDFNYKGELDFMDNIVDSSTGTIRIRGKLSNESREILPGMFARVRVPAGIKKNAILIDEKAIGTSLAGKFILVVGENNLVEQKLIEVAEVVDGLRVVRSGLVGDELYILTGIQFLMPGMPVAPMDPSQMPPQGTQMGAGAPSSEQQNSDNKEIQTK